MVCVDKCSYIGHLKERTVKEQMVRDSTEVIRKAVLRMLPRNKLRDVSDLLLVLGRGLARTLCYINWSQVMLQQAYTMHQFWRVLDTDAYGFGNSIPLANTCMSTWRWGSLCTKLYTLLFIWLFQILQDRMLKLRIFPDENHPFDTQPLDKFVMPPRKIREQRPRERRAAVRAQQGTSRESDWSGCRYLEGVSNKVVHNTPFSLGWKCHWELFQKRRPASIPLECLHLQHHFQTS